MVFQLFLTAERIACKALSSSQVPYFIVHHQSRPRQLTCTSTPNAVTYPGRQFRDQTCRLAVQRGCFGKNSSVDERARPSWPCLWAAIPESTLRAYASYHVPFAQHLQVQLERCLATTTLPLAKARQFSCFYLFALFAWTVRSNNVLLWHDKMLH